MLPMLEMPQQRLFVDLASMSIRARARSLASSMTSHFQGPMTCDMRQAAPYRRLRHSDCEQCLKTRCCKTRLCRHPRLSCEAIVFFFNDTATTEIYTLSLHDALPPA